MNPTRIFGSEEIRVLANADPSGQYRPDGADALMAAMLLAGDGFGDWTDSDGRYPYGLLVLNEAGREAARTVGWGEAA